LKLRSAIILVLAGFGIAFVFGLMSGDGIWPAKTPPSDAPTVAIVRAAVSDLGDAPGQASGEHVVTQAVLGTELKILEIKDGWLRVEMPDQYKGWIPEADVVAGNETLTAKWRSGRQALITATEARMEPVSKSDSAVTAVQGTVLPVLEEKGAWLRVAVPGGGQVWVDTPSARVFKSYGEVFARRGSADDLLALARKFVDVPYLWGGTTPRGFDCSGYTQFVFKHFGYLLPRDADLQFALGQEAPSRSDLQPGDLVYFSTYAPGPSHMGIYLGNNEYINAREPGVAIDSFDPKAKNYNEKLDKNYIGAKRVIGVLPPAGW
jgi:cell wall-associated NlpC family hydrolase